MPDKRWEKLLQLIEGSIGKTPTALWIAPLKPAFSKSSVSLEAPNELHRAIIINRYLPTIRKCIRALWGTEPDVDIRSAAAAPARKTTPPARSGPERSGRTTPAVPVSLNNDYTFDNFVLGSCNKAAYSATASAARNPALKHNPLFVSGGVGLGKTHLLQAAAHHCLGCGEHTVVYIPADKLMDKITEACKNKVIAQLRKKLGAARLLIIDDVHSISGKNQIQEEIFYIFTALLKNRAQVILSSDRPPERIARLQQRLVARFHAGSIVALSPPTLKTRVAIIEKKAELLRISIPRKCTALLASRIRTNIRRLEGALTTLAAYSKMGEAPINQELVEEVLRIGLFESDGDALSIHKIQKLVAERFDIKMGSLLGQERSAHFVVPRQLAMYLCRRLLNSSYADIGAAFSGRDHTTALHSCRNAGELVENSSEIRELIDGLITTIGK